MRKLGKFLVIFSLVLGAFQAMSCQGSKLVWSTSNGIVTYNRATGQFEMMWDTSQEREVMKTDTVWICPDDSTVWTKKGIYKR